MLRSGLDSDQVFDAPNQEWVASGSRTLLLDVPAGPTPSVTVAPIQSYANGVGHTSVGGPVAWSRVKVVPVALPYLSIYETPTYHKAENGDRVLNVPNADGELVVDRALQASGGPMHRGTANLSLLDSPWDESDTIVRWSIPSFPPPEWLTTQTRIELEEDRTTLAVEFFVDEDDRVPAFDREMHVRAFVTSRTEGGSPNVPANIHVRYHYPAERWFEWRAKIDQGHDWPVSCDQPAFFGGVTQASWSEDNAFWFVMDQRGRPVLQSAFDMLAFIPKYSLLSKVAGFLLEAPWTKSYTQGVAFTLDLFNSPLSVKQDSQGNLVAGSHRPEEFTMVPGLWMEHRHHFFEGEEYDVHGYVGQTRRQPAVKFAQQWFGIFTLMYDDPTPSGATLEGR